MPRLIYGLLGAALVSLVVGFVVRTSTIPLFVSIALSAAVIVLILVGISRRLREQGESGDLEADEVEDIVEASESDDAGKRAEKNRPRRTPAGHEAGVTTVLEPLAAADAEPGPQKTKRPRPGVAPARRPQLESRPKGKAKAKAKAKPSRVVVVPGRPRYHRRSCRFAKGKETKEIAVTTARKNGYEPCSVCDPA